MAHGHIGGVRTNMMAHGHVESLKNDGGARTNRKRRTAYGGSWTERIHIKKV